MPLKRKNIYLTFYSYKKSTHGLNISNGFSFCRDTTQEYKDIFIEIDTPPEKILSQLPDDNSIDKIYASVSFPSELNTIYPLLNKKWVLGGPLIENIVQRDIHLPCELVSKTFESYLNKPLSSEFNPYFIDFVNKERPRYLYYTCNLGQGCYWSKCKFCDYNYFQYNSFIRPNTEKILQQLPYIKCKTNFVHTGLSAIPADILKIALNTKIPKNIMLSFAVRADPSIRALFATYDQLISTKHIYNIGLEAFSQTAINILNKNININTLLEIVEIVLQANSGMIFLSIMDHYPFTNKLILEESLETIQSLDKLARKYSRKKLFIYNAGPTVWENQAAISEFTDNFITVPYTTETKLDRFKDVDHIPRYYKLCDKYLAVIPENSEAFKYNQQIALALTKSRLNIVGNDFLSLKNIRHRKSYTKFIDYFRTKVI